ncbi:ribose-5-phosphate isomerase RpiA [Chitinophaga barathri]|uniref:Ribose-5-phosphate isomerase A n=1 Tax=Chitinophaga barathri TaxID=1647451 RepID=A0A3N4MJY0_9BACT|nr:ribose-5-phosphate isomerase RpiA [Chitinophaga barathri]RPD39889.1 ribose-5-phosphate isomerase RpiA [Chitinophaga barathri]
MTAQKDKEKQAAAKVAAGMIKDGQVVGLGTGSTAEFVIREIALRGLRITGVPTSVRTARLAVTLGIPLADINSVEAIDITIDGADEFTPELYLLKGGGGAFLREKIVAERTLREIIIADSSKLVAQLGAFRLPIEVIPFAQRYVEQQLEKLGASCLLREGFVTDEGNRVLDADFGLIGDPAALALELNNITGLVAHGLFINLADTVIMGKGAEIVRFNRHGS